jgi:hypothetical protein
MEEVVMVQARRHIVCAAFMLVLTSVASAAPATQGTESPATQPAVEPTTNPSQAFQQPTLAAGDTLDLIVVFRRDHASFLTSKHGLMKRDLGLLEAAAAAVANDDQANPAATADLVSAFSSSLDRAIKRTDTIANRARETQEAKDTALAIQAKLKSIRDE